MAVVPLLSPQGWDYVLILATPALAIVLDRWAETPRAWRAVLTPLLVVIALGLFGLVTLVERLVLRGRR